MPVTGDYVQPPEWSNWKFGDWGAAGPEGTQLRYHSLNCQVYEDGSIGPRPGWRKVETLSGANAVVPRALVWRQPGEGEEKLAGKRWLMLMGSPRGGTNSIVLRELDPTSGTKTSTAVVKNE